MMSNQALICDPATMAKAVERIAKETVTDFITEQSEKPSFALAGLYKQGVPLAGRIADKINALSGYRPEIALIDISMYRDDFGRRSAIPLIRPTVVPFEMNDADIILVDDVLSTGRTIRAALEAVTDYGRPRLIKLAVLIDRNQTEYPIMANYIGMDIDLDKGKKILVKFQESDGEDGVFEVDWHQETAGEKA